MLLQTGELLGDPLAEPLLQAAAGEPITKPEDHTGGDLTDMFTLTISPEQAGVIYARVKAMVAAGETTSGTRSRGLGGFEEAWRDYVQFLEREQNRVC